MKDNKASQENQKNESPQTQHQEEISAELLAERALAETIREGGAFARKNDES